MKRIITLLAAMALALAAFAQTPEEIVSKMEEAFKAHEAEGLIMTMDIKIPIIGTISSDSRMLGDKIKVVGNMAGQSIITWTDGKTSWSYDSQKNEIEIKDEDLSKKSDSDNKEMFTGVTDGYDVSIKKETDTEWQLHCKKSKTNTDKDDPKNMELVVAKGTFYPVILKAKLKGVTLTMRNIGFGVKEKEVTFNAADYPGVTIVDKRNQ